MQRTVPVPEHTIDAAHVGNMIHHDSLVECGSVDVEHVRTATAVGGAELHGNVGIDEGAMAHVAEAWFCRGYQKAMLLISVVGCMTMKESPSLS